MGGKWERVWELAIATMKGLHLHNKSAAQWRKEPIFWFLLQSVIQGTTMSITCSDTAVGFCSTRMKPFCFANEMKTLCRMQAFPHAHTNTNNSHLMLQWREKINLDIAAVKCLSLPTLLCAHGLMMLDTLQLCLQSHSVSLTPGTLAHSVLGIFVSMEPADLETHNMHTHTHTQKE